MDLITIPNVEDIRIGHGAHKTRGGELCIMELSAWLAGEPHSDHPECVSPVLAAFLRRWNDDLDDAGRQRLKPYAGKVVGTNRSEENEAQRAWLVIDWLVRVYTSIWLDLAGLTIAAQSLRELPEINSKLVVDFAQPTIDKARQAAAVAAGDTAVAAGDTAVAAGDTAENAGNAAWAAGDARVTDWDTAWAVGNADWNADWNAAWNAAWSIAWDAAWSIAWDTVGATARATTWDAAWAAGNTAVRAAAELQPTIISLQTSGFNLLDRLILVHNPPAQAA